MQKHYLDFYKYLQGRRTCCVRLGASTMTKPHMQSCFHASPDVVLLSLSYEKYNFHYFVWRKIMTKPHMSPAVMPPGFTKLGKNLIYHLLNKNFRNMLSFCLIRKGLTKRLTCCYHPKPRPPSPTVSDDISLFLYRK